MDELPARLSEIVTDFSELVGLEKLEYLLYFAENLAPLPAWLEDQRDAMEPVPECMTPVFMYVEAQDGRLFFHFDVPSESPTVRGYAAVLSQGLNGVSPEEVLRIPTEFYFSMGLQRVLSAQRLSGLSAILAHMKQLVLERVNT